MAALVDVLKSFWAYFKKCKYFNIFHLININKAIYLFLSLSLLVQSLLLGIKLNLELSQRVSHSLEFGGSLLDLKYYLVLYQNFILVAYLNNKLFSVYI